MLAGSEKWSWRNQGPRPANVVYRAAGPTGQPVEVRFATLAPASATVSDAWARLSAVDAGVEPSTIEIEVRYIA